MKKEKKGYLILPNTQHSCIEKTALQLSEINRILQEGNCFAFIILDACHSGILSRNNMDPFYIEYDGDKSCITLASCSENESSFPYEEKEQGAFTYFLSEILRGMPLGEEIIIESLKLEVCNKMLEWGKANYKKQTPTLVGTSVGNISVATRNDKSNEYLPLCISEDVIKVNDITDLTTSKENTQDSYALWQSNVGVQLPKVAAID